MPLCTHLMSRYITAQSGKMVALCWESLLCGHYYSDTVASFPGSAKLSIAISTEVMKSWVGPGNDAKDIVQCTESSHRHA